MIDLAIVYNVQFWKDEVVGASHTDMYHIPSCSRARFELTFIRLEKQMWSLPTDTKATWYDNTNYNISHTRMERIRYLHRLVWEALRIIRLSNIILTKACMTTTLQRGTINNVCFPIRWRLCCWHHKIVPPPKQSLWKAHMYRFWLFCLKRYKNNWGPCDMSHSKKTYRPSTFMFWLQFLRVLSLTGCIAICN